MALEKINPTKTPSWNKLLEHYQVMKDCRMQDFNWQDRFSRFSVQLEDCCYDYSKNIITEETMALLLEFAAEMKLEDAIAKLFSGDKINETEDRAVLHTALRMPRGTAVKLGNKNIVNDVHAVRVRMKKFSREIISGARTGFTNKPITDVVNIGIGGSDLGPKMVTDALAFYKNHLNMHYVSNIDGTYLDDFLSKLNPETTLFVVVSKTFTTDETLANATFIKNWFLKKGCILDIERHFVAVTSNDRLAVHFGIATENIFPMWDWVGGRFSLWSAVGLSIALSIGYANFEKLLEGAYETDLHFKEAPFEHNIPVIAGLLSVWYNNFFEAQTEAVISYSQYMKSFPSFLQQMIMESNGKLMDRNGEQVTYQTGNVIWGDVGANAQHAFFQLFHQGTKLIPVEFIGYIKSINDNNHFHIKLMNNFFAQIDALLYGRTKEEVARFDCKDIQKPYKYFEGNNPSSVYLFDQLNPKTIGSLIAMYEHKTFVQGVLWNIFSFDQFGVELGKELSQVYADKNSLKSLIGEENDNQTLFSYFSKKVN